MKNLSRWASRHIIAARVLIILLQIIVALLAIFLANQLSDQDIHFSFAWIYLGIGMFLILIFLYPQTVSNPRTHFKKQKTFDFLLIALGFCLVVFLTDQLNQPFTSSSPVSASEFIKTPSAYKNAEAEKLLNAFKSGEKTKFTAREKKILKKEFKYQLKKYALEKLTGGESDATSIILIILTCLVAAGLFLFLTALACEISCNGSGTGAILVLLLGTAGIVLGTIALIRAINKGAEKRKKSS